MHARGSAARGSFECYEPLTQYTKAAPFKQAGKITPVFVRLSTINSDGFRRTQAHNMRDPYTNKSNWTW